MYEATSKPETRNRFIIWRTSHDVLELSESSMDWSLTGNRVKYRFQVRSCPLVVIEKYCQRSLEFGKPYCVNLLVIKKLILYFESSTIDSFLQKPENEIKFLYS